ncbi:UDP-N-acetylmuramate--L-alanine ligase [Rubritalea tangerina]|uniref:Multifunctional fusion protein n=1 Tax=Rubritalea tangerina TaxID=430798 RepID=A0ABW4ZCJ8_9BACT
MKDFSERLMRDEQAMRIHLIGVAGSGMSGLASLLIGMGHNVSGCDRVTSAETERLQRAGLAFSSPHNAHSVADADVVVYSSAIRDENVALAAARSAGIPTVRRAECLAAILATKDGVVISGTHGKTTTSAMSAHVLRRGAVHPSHYVGAEIPVLGTNAHWDEKGSLMVAEGDESDGTLALYQPKHAVVLNVEEEHLDFYSGIEHIKEVFTTLLERTSGSIIFCAECEVATELCGQRGNAISYGWSNADFIAENLKEQGGVVAFDVVHKGELLGRVELGVPGRHNALNALASIALATECGVSFSDASRALATFAGARRRFETKYLSKRLRVVDDYGHHPTELAATLQTARSLEPKRLVVLFQPHRYSRTQKLADDFGKVLQAADKVFVTDVYPASELPIDGVSGQTIVDAMKSHGSVSGQVVGEVASAHYAVGNALKAGDMLITLGAGNVHEVGTKIARDQSVLEVILGECGDGNAKVCLYEPMRKHTTMLVGGPAQFWVEPQTHQCFANAVRYCRERGIPVRVIGRGSNLLVRDGGIRGVVIHPSKGVFGEVSVEGDLVTAGAGVRFKKLASIAQKAGLTGFEWMEGIPGNVGGGLRMNAGAMGTETFDQVIEVTFLDEDGEIRTRKREEIVAHYRNVPELRRCFALSATFKGQVAEAGAIQGLMEASMEKRRSSQPLAASAGCIFKNPEAMPAGMLVDTLGFKDSAVGKARVSLEHGNFIVNDGKATAKEVLDLIDKIRVQAREEKGIELETEVQIIGEDEQIF